VLALLGGVVFALLLWLALVPWDLSEIDPAGRVIEGGGDDHAGWIGLVVASILGTATLWALVPRQGTRAAFFALGGCIAWAILIAWRVGTARTDGANLFLIPFVAVVVPIAGLGPACVAGVGRWAERRRAVRA
jgi:hypothetical protein